jgi:subtilisin family serine protease
LLFAVLALALTALAPAAAQDTLQVPNDVADSIAAEKTAATYIVVMADEPLVASVDRDDLSSAAAKAKGKKIKAGHDKALKAVGASTSAKVYDYTVSMNGFAAELTTSQAAAMQAQPGVLFVVPDEVRQLTTDSSPDFLGINDGAGPAAKGYDGEGVVVGVIDQGIWPEHPSVADDGSYAAPPASFTGTGCEFGSAVAGAQAFNAADADFTCNNKLLAAKAYGDGFHGGVGIGLDPGSFLSARDEDGHGTHTATTAAGNADVPASILGADYGTVTGIAPRAHISVYKACWSTGPGTGGCNVSDLVAAIDQAVFDGVDVINYSIGSSAFAIGPDDISFLFAADAGVFVATSAGNDGPGSETVGSPATTPWLTSVGASTQTRDFRGTVTLGDGTVFEGVTVTGGTDELPLVDSEDLGNTLCIPGAGFSEDITGKIVLCQRGAIARVAKSQAVFEAGGAGMVLFNATLNTLNTDNHYVPSLHISHEDGPVVKAYVDTAGSGATALLSGGEKVDAQGSVMAAFSSRGANRQSADIIKPDVTAPGVNILAGNTPAAILGSPGEYFQAISGTSMSSPHVAGSFALLKQAHPNWSAAMAKSALMTTARQDVVKEDGATPADPFDMGAGHIDWSRPAVSPSSPFEPGLAYDAGFNEYLGYLCDADQSVFGNPAATCAALAAAGIPTDASDLNLASIGVGELVGSQTVTRTVTAVTGVKGNIVFHPTVEAPAGFDVAVSPSKLKLRDGQSASYTVTITNDGSAALGEWAFGSLTWRGGGFDVYSPIAVRAFEFAAPAQIDGTGTTGSASFDVQFGYDGSYTAGNHGLVQAAETAGNVIDDPANDINTALASGVGVTFHAVNVPADTAFARFSLFDAFTDGADDLDLYVFGPGGGFVGGSGSGTSEEQVDVVLPAAGVYTVVVHGWQTHGPDSNYTLFDWSVPLATGGSLSIDAAPTAATVGGTGTVDVSWSSLTAGKKYLGAVSHSGPAGLLGLTLVDVEA